MEFSNLLLASVILLKWHANYCWVLKYLGFTHLCNLVINNWMLITYIHTYIHKYLLNWRCMQTDAQIHIQARSLTQTNTRLEAHLFLDKRIHISRSASLTQIYIHLLPYLTYTLWHNLNTHCTGELSLLVKDCHIADGAVTLPSVERLFSYLILLQVCAASLISYASVCVRLPFVLTTLPVTWRSSHPGYSIICIILCEGLFTFWKIHMSTIIIISFGKPFLGAYILVSQLNKLLKTF